MKELVLLVGVLLLLRLLIISPDGPSCEILSIEDGAENRVWTYV